MNGPKPSSTRRVAAIISLALSALVVAIVAIFALRNIVWMLAALVSLAVAAAGGWWTVTERVPRRAVGIAVFIAGVLGIAFSLFSAETDMSRPVIGLALFAVATAGAAAAGRAAMLPDLHELDRVHGLVRVRPSKPVLICNRKSGGGKVDRFALPELAEEMGVDVVFLEPGLELDQIARDAIARGADCIGMAGGDGSQALVASIAHEHDIPFVCISAGTRNHFAQDLGFDKEDPRKGMAAFREGVERFIDFGTVGGRFFVNNVSMGVYATIVQQDSYRDAKTVTAQEMLPELLGSQAEPFDLQFTDPDGSDVADSFLIMVSNNPYVWGASPDVGQRRTMDSGRLGVFAVNAKTGTEAAQIAARTALGLTATDPHVHEFTCETFEVRSRGGTAYAGVDGEALTLDTPLEFRIHARGLRMLVPKGSLAQAVRRRSRGYSPARLFAIAMGHRPKALSAG